jgi:hypothetical protein
MSKVTTLLRRTKRPRKKEKGDGRGAESGLNEFGANESKKWRRKRVTQRRQRNRKTNDREGKRTKLERKG